LLYQGLSGHRVAWTRGIGGGGICSFLIDLASSVGSGGSAFGDGAVGAFGLADDAASSLNLRKSPTLSEMGWGSLLRGGAFSFAVRRYCAMAKATACIAVSSVGALKLQTHACILSPRLDQIRSVQCVVAPF